MKGEIIEKKKKKERKKHKDDAVINWLSLSVVRTNALLNRGSEKFESMVVVGLFTRLQ